MVSYVTVSVLLTTYRTQLRRQMNERDSAIRAILTDTLMSYETGALTLDCLRHWS